MTNQKAGGGRGVDDGRRFEVRRTPSPPTRRRDRISAPVISPPHAPRSRGDELSSAHQRTATSPRLPPIEREDHTSNQSTSIGRSS
eukprot:scaffold201112_cov35-Tisochrysis_lutea.AAC.1